MKICKKL